MIPLVWVGQLGAGGGAEGIVDIAIGLWTVNVRSSYTRAKEIGTKRRLTLKSIGLFHLFVW
jgi:hypothetical protein